MAKNVKNIKKNIKKIGLSDEFINALVEPIEHLNKVYEQERDRATNYNNIYNRLDREEKIEEIKNAT